MDVTILILSCDKNKDLWEPMIKTISIYWKNKDNMPIKFISGDETWTVRIREALSKVTTKYVIMMCDDHFIRDKVDMERIREYVALMNDNIACINFEDSFGGNKKTDIEGLELRPNKSPYMCSTQPALWNRKILIELLKGNMDIWQWEIQIIDSKYNFYINGGDPIIDVGYHNSKWMGLKKGKWCREIVPFFRKHNININYNDRGFYD